MALPHSLVFVIETEREAVVSGTRAAEAARAQPGGGRLYTPGWSPPYG